MLQLLVLLAASPIIANFYGTPPSTKITAIAFATTAFSTHCSS
jgi:hypothetical protein